ncbi:biotin transporter BioY [Variibacter gotjawalensis]|uniref:Biotin transporter n=1 Tax=Variibacter gotjawalensis TaxID=1333996 RepID=A0A0S3PSX5_9BRAD|nr:biotin transporter BioY [Variibacter gotjawalensis]NIK49365.1 biotin transport system substrate-specific component [Variibacter gotjawalensis]RZS51216.1 biotin transport system substrate-specific component [Variibacter gotjawalensis]BAT59050.1 biotin transporter BioY [Variibacter gotjawalensis]
MSSSAVTSFSPLRLSERTLAWQVAAVVVGTLILALSSHVKVPMYPVPMTMQTFAVTLIGALYGWRLATVTVLVWLGEAALGLPVLAGSGGVLSFVGPTAGYLFAFPLAAALTGYLAERGWNGQRVTLAFAAMLLGNALCLVLGAAWLSTLVGFEKAIVAGVTPFIVGGIVKSALAAATLKALPR